MTTPNDITSTYIAERERQLTPEEQAARRVADYEAEHGEVSTDPAADPQLRQAYMATAQQSATPTNKRGFVADLGAQTVGGVRDAITQTNRAIGSLADWMDENVLNLGYITYGEDGLSYSKTKPEGAQLPELPEVEHSDRVVPSLARGVSQFLTDFIPFNRFAKFLGMGTAVGSTAAGAATMAAAFDPFEKRLSNLVQEQPSLSNPVTEYLAADPNDTEAEGRFKNALEGTGLGMLTEGFFRSLRVFKIAKAKAGETKPVLEAAPPAEVTSVAKAPQVEAKATNVVTDNAKPYVQASKEKLDEFVTSMKAGEYDKAAAGLDFNFARMQTTGDIKGTLDATSKAFEQNIDTAKGGIRTHATTAEVAKLIGTDTAQLNNLYAGTKNLDARMLAARELLLGSAKKLHELAKVAGAPTGTDMDLLALRAHAALHAGIQAEVKGVQTEIARALSAMRIIATHSVDPDALNSLLRGTGGRNVNKAFAQKLAKMTDPAEISNYVRQGWYAKTRDAVVEYFINSILSGVPTQTVNIVSNSVMIPLSMAERALTASVGAGRRLLGTADADTAAFHEVNGQLFGVVQGFKDALHITARGQNALKQAVNLSGRGKFQEAAEVLRQEADEFGAVYRTAVTEEPILDPMSKLEHRHRAISAQAFEANGTLGAALDRLGFVVGLPSRALVTADELFKTINHRMEMYSQAYKAAAQKGLTGEAFKADVARTLSDPGSVLHAQSLSAARKGTFTQELGEFGSTVQQMAAIRPEMRLIVPFIRTPTNILKYVGERTPALNLLAKSHREALKAGGRQADEVIAKMAMGTLFYTLGAELFSKGLITGGGPTDPDVYRFWNRDGKWKPYSFKVGEEYIAFDRGDPIGMFFGLIADVSDISNHYFDEDASLKDMPSAVMLALSKNLTNRTWVAGITNLIDALDPRQGSADPAALHYLRDLVSAFVPNFFKGIRTEMDPEVKEVWNLVDAFKAKTPGFSKDVPAQRSLFGEKVLYPNRLGPDFLSPYANPTASDDPVVKEIMRLNIGFKKSAKKIGNVMLTPELYTRRDELAGKEVRDAEGRNLRERLTYEMSTERYKNATDGDEEYEGSRGYILKRIITGYRQMAEMQLFKEHPELRQSVEDDKRRAAAILTGKFFQ